VSAALVFGCGDGAPVSLSPVPELIPALDVNPDPDIVEINLAATVAEVEYEPGVFTEVLAHRDASVDDSAGTVPGPLIATKQGDRLIVHFVNELPTRFTTVHWHGLRLPAEMDGNPMVSGEVAPGDGFEYDFIVQDAGLFWYHPHVDTDEQLELGLQGPLLVRSPDEPVVDRERYFALDDVELGDDGAVVIEPSRLNTPVDVTLGDVEIWEVINDGDGDHPFHLHGVFFQVLDGAERNRRRSAGRTRRSWARGRRCGSPSSTPSPGCGCTTVRYRSTPSAA
jgi:FtsP/CotA-like multicopper oxidase with cupredoxin domain